MIIPYSIQILKLTIVNIQIHILSFYDNYTVCDFTVLKLSMITINKKNDEIWLSFRSI